MFYRPKSSWTWTLAVVTFTSAVTALATEVALYEAFSQYSYYRWIYRPVNSSLGLTIFASVYQLLLLYDTLASSNAIQLIGLCMYAALLCVYEGLQIDLIDLSDVPGALPIARSRTAISGAFLAIICAVSWKVYGEFRWTVFQQFSADLKLQKKYFTYQVFLTLLKFDLFFQIGYQVQLLATLGYERFPPDSYYSYVLVQITLAGLLLEVINIFVSAYWVRHESKVGMLITAIPSSLALIAMSLFQNVTTIALYHSVSSMQFLGFITVVLSVVTLIFAIICTINFGKGLKPYISSSRIIRNLEEEYEMRSIDLEDSHPLADC